MKNFARNQKHHTAYIYVCLFKQGDEWKLIFSRENFENKDN